MTTDGDYIYEPIVSSQGLALASVYFSSLPLSSKSHAAMSFLKTMPYFKVLGRIYKSKAASSLHDY